MIMMKMTKSKTLEGILFIFLSIIIILILYNLRYEIKNYENLGYAGAFIISIISSGTLLLPAPGWAVVLGLATSLNPLILGIVAGIGSALGELTGYFAGLGGNYIFDNRFKQFDDLMKKYGVPTLFVLALIPNPFFDIAGVLAGASKMRWQDFLIPVTLGKVIRFIILCYLAVFGVNLIGMSL
ncbi:VTT domain-containing protein [Candidatus Micrarchaeota archaeon]|nr:VTT domain-containing protein [Candidatus Micrarchaeota archaeon]